MNIILISLSVIGVFETLYLIRSRTKDKEPVCVIGSDKCADVLSSKYNKQFGVHNDVWGLLFYLFILLMSVLIFFEIYEFSIWQWLIRIASGVALLQSFYFFYLQARVIKAWCFWCLVSFGLVALIFISSLFL
jgi:uncharacterized membrane protein